MQQLMEQIESRDNIIDKAEIMHRVRILISILLHLLLMYLICLSNIDVVIFRSVYNYLIYTCFIIYFITAQSNSVKSYYYDCYMAD